MRGLFGFACALIFVASLAQAGGACQPSSESCAFYSCEEQEMHCGEKGYLLHFGERLCDRYLENQPRASLALQEWYPRVRFCLEEAVSDLAGPLSCGDLEDRAFETHYGCYIQTGFCNLSFGDKLTVLAIAGGEAVEPQALAVSLEIARRCGI